MLVRQEKQPAPGSLSHPLRLSFLSLSTIYSLGLIVHHLLVPLSFFHFFIHSLTYFKSSNPFYVFYVVSIYNYISLILHLLSSLLPFHSHLIFSPNKRCSWRLTGSELTVVTSLPPCQARRHLRVWLQIE